MSTTASPTRRGRNPARRWSLCGVACVLAAIAAPYVGGFTRSSYGLGFVTVLVGIVFITIGVARTEAPEAVHRLRTWVRPFE